MTRRRIHLRLILAAAVIAPVPAFADAGVPVIAVAWPLAWMALLPIIAIETLVAKRTFTTDWGVAIKVAAVANAASAAIGVPIAWIATFAGTLIPAYLGERFLRPDIASVVAAPMYATWLPPIQKHSVWMIPSALAIFCIPTFFVTVAVERRVAQKIAAGSAPEQVRRWSWQANILTYALACVGLLINAVLLYRGAAA
jgi:hypothetical protein